MHLVVNLTLTLNLLLAVPAFALRLVSTSPQTTELLFQLGLGNQIVGAAVGSNYPAEAAQLPTIGLMFSPSTEKTLALQPDWVVLDTHNLNPAYAASLEAARIPIFVWNTYTPKALLRDGRALAKKTHHPIPLSWDRWSNCFKALGQKKHASRRTALFFVWMDPPIVVGHGAFLSALLSELGYENALPTRFRNPYVPVNQEWLLQRKIDAVFYLRHRTESDSKDRFKHWWPTATPEITALDADEFARASLTPFQNLGRVPIAFSLPGACRDRR